MKNINFSDSEILKLWYTLLMMESSLIDRLMNLFPGVIWNDYSEKKMDTDFWELLEDIFINQNTPFAFYQALASFKDSHPTRKKCFSVLYPEFSISELDFKNAKSNDDEKFNCFQFFIDFDEKIFKKVFCEVTNINIDSNFQNGDLFPLSTHFAKWDEWICSYDSKHYLFHWDDDNNYNIKKYSPNTPFEAFQRFAHYYYTLVRIGIETEKGIIDLSKAANNALGDIYKYYKLYSCYEKMNEYGESEYDLLKGNIDFGIETKKNGETNYYPKNRIETDIEIKSAIKKEDYEHKYSKKYILSFYDCSKINELFEKLKNMNLPDFPDYGENNHFPKLDYLKSHTSYLTRNGQKFVDKISEKVNNRDEYIEFDENTEDKRISIEDDYIKAELKEKVKSSIAEVFNNKRELDFKNAIKAYDKNLFWEDVSLLLFEKKQSIEDNEVFLMYLQKMKIMDCKSDLCLQKYFKKKIQNAVENIGERMNYE